MSMPCAKPISSATRQRDRDARPTADSQAAPLACDDSLAMITPVSPMTEPTERSMPPVMMTKLHADGEDAEHRDLAQRIDRVRLAEEVGVGDGHSARTS